VYLLRERYFLANQTTKAPFNNLLFKPAINTLYLLKSFQLMPSYCAESLLQQKLALEK